MGQLETCILCALYVQVGYCQGMAFVAGVILMYLPEEPAFRVLCQLLDEDRVGLRSMYLPGLNGLKEDLRMLDWLMERLMPELKQHLEVIQSKSTALFLESLLGRYHVPVIPQCQCMLYGHAYCQLNSKPFTRFVQCVALVRLHSGASYVKPVIRPVMHGGKAEAWVAC